jgi:signal transduction histidine kinase
VVPIEVGERNVSGFAIYTDITDQKRRERTLERQNERLDQFASIVSHDLRNPLNVAQGHLDLARSNCECDADALDRVEQSHERMSRMIDELLSLARHGNIVGDTVPVELREVAEAAWSNVDTGEATLFVEGDRDLVADRERFVELLENLFRNAVEHGSTSPHSHAREEAREHAGPAVSVTVGTWDDGIFVADDGPGIPEAEREQVFESGYTTARDGTGFGLTIVEQIAEAHGWSVEVVDDEGARFEFSVPDDGVSSPD